jgi:hypothetical protein
VASWPYLISGPKRPLGQSAAEHSRKCCATPIRLDRHRTLNHLGGCPARTLRRLSRHWRFHPWHFFPGSRFGRACDSASSPLIDNGAGALRLNSSASGSWRGRKAGLQHARLNQSGRSIKRRVRCRSWDRSVSSSRCATSGCMTALPIAPDSIAACTSDSVPALSPSTARYRRSRNC